MRIVAVVSLVCMTAALSGCGHSGSGSVEFVSSNTDSVLLDFAARPEGELVLANNTATQQCQIFHRDTAVLESLNLRREGVIRATYLCRNGTRTAQVDNTRRRQ